MRGKPEALSSEVISSLEKVRPGEVDVVITNIEKNLQKAWEEAENKGVNKGVIKVARQMLLEEEPIEKIIRYTGLSEEELEKLK